MIYAIPASSVSSLQLSLHFLRLEFNALMTTQTVTGTTLNALCPLPNLWKERNIWNPFHSLSSETHKQNTNRTEIDFICFSISSHSLSGTRRHLVFGRQARGSIAESDRTQDTAYSRAETQNISQQSFLRWVQRKKDRTLSGDDDMFWVWQNTGPHTDIRNNNL